MPISNQNMHPTTHKLLWTVIGVLAVVVIAGSIAWWQKEREAVMVAYCAGGDIKQELRDDCDKYRLANIESLLLSGWKTYENEEFKFSLNYPPEWTYEPLNNVFISFKNKKDEKSVYTSNFPVDIEIPANKLGWALDEWIEKNVKDIIYKVGPVYFNGNEGVKYVVGGIRPSIVTYVRLDNNILTISTPTNSDFTEIYTQILSTIRFTQ